MAQKVVTELVDDFDGTTAEETVRFAVDGVEYEIDLSKDNAGKLRQDFERYVTKARRTGGRAKRRPSKGRPGVDQSQTKAIREWAQSQGLAVSGRGRISAEVARAFEDSHRR